MSRATDRTQIRQERPDLARISDLLKAAIAAREALYSRLMPIRPVPRRNATVQDYQWLQASIASVAPEIAAAHEEFERVQDMIDAGLTPYNALDADDKNLVLLLLTRAEAAVVLYDAWFFTRAQSDAEWAEVEAECDCASCARKRREPEEEQS